MLGVVYTTGEHKHRSQKESHFTVALIVQSWGGGWRDTDPSCQLLGRAWVSARHLSSPLRNGLPPMLWCSVPTSELWRRLLSLGPFPGIWPVQLVLKYSYRGSKRAIILYHEVTAIPYTLESWFFLNNLWAALHPAILPLSRICSRCCFLPSSSQRAGNSDDNPSLPHVLQLPNTPALDVSDTNTNVFSVSLEKVK